MSKTILIVSYAEDAHAVHLGKMAASRGIKAVLWDISKYPTEGEISLVLSNKKPTVPTLILNGQSYSSNQIVGIWWRRPGGAKKNKVLTKMDQYVNIESEFLIRSLQYFLVNSNWISDPEATRLACRKPVQLQVAKEVGLSIPDSCITNSPAMLMSFLERMGSRPITMKAVGSAFMQLDPNGRTDTSENKVILTRVVKPELLVRNAEMTRNCPVIFQEVIRKDFDVRVTIVDDQVFAAGIRLEGCNDPNNLDWRNEDGKRVYFPHQLPNDVVDKCIVITRKLGLRFGCVDLAFSENTGYTFFEINPQGQWLPSELKLGYTVAGSLIDALTR